MLNLNISHIPNMDIAKTTFTRQFYLTTSDYEGRSTDNRKKNHVHVAIDTGEFGANLSIVFILSLIGRRSFVTFDR